MKVAEAENATTDGGSLSEAFSRLSFWSFVLTSCFHLRLLRLRESCSRLRVAAAWRLGPQGLRLSRRGGERGLLDLPRGLAFGPVRVE